VKDVTQIQARTMSETQIAEVREFLRRMGVSDATVSHPTTTLEDLFMRVIGESARVAGASAPVGDGNGRPSAAASQPVTQDAGR
jgi:ABC-2 type transport system ATP-binding protein